MRIVLVIHANVQPKIHVDVMKTFRQLMEAQESSNQIKKIKIVFGEGGSANDAEWNLGKIETEITLAMGDHSRDCFALADDIGKFNGIPKEEAETYKETTTDALMYGMTNIMNGGDDIYFWTNGTRMKGEVQKHGLWPAVFEQVSHEMVHGTRLLLSKHMVKSKKWWEDDWPSIGDDPKKDKINEQAFAFAHGEAIQQMVTEFLKMAEKYLPELKGK